MTKPMPQHMRHFSAFQQIQTLEEISAGDYHRQIHHLINQAVNHNDSQAARLEKTSLCRAYTKLNTSFYNEFEK